MKAFSRAHTKVTALEYKLRRGKTMCISKCNPDYNTAHPNEIREYAQVKKFTELTKRITEQVQKKQERNETFRSKLHHVG